mgnify:CR=1 FL=1
MIAAAIAAILVVTATANYLLITRDHPLCVAAWLVTIGGTVLFIALAGRATTGRWAGIAIDNRNRISLSKFQMVAWTVLFDDVELTAAEHQAFVDAVIKARPQGSKGTYVKKVSLSSSMGPGVKLDPSTAITV